MARAVSKMEDTTFDNKIRDAIFYGHQRGYLNFIGLAYSRKLKYKKIAKLLDVPILKLSR